MLIPAPSNIVMTYDNIFNLIIEYCRNSNESFMQKIPVFVLFAQERINRDYKGLGQEIYVEATLGANTSQIQKPIDWLKTISFFCYVPQIGTNQLSIKPVFLRSFEYVTRFGNDVGQPKVFSDYANDFWLLAPIADKSYPVVISYLQKQVYLSPTQQTNWFTFNAPQLLFYATFLEAALYLQTQSLIDQAKLFYEPALAQFKVLDQELKQTRQQNIGAD